MRIVIDNYLPKPKARPRVFDRGGRKSVFSPTSENESNLAFLIASQAIRKGIGVACYVGVEIFSKKKLRGDCDNYLKTVLDAVQKAEVIKNDSLVKDSRCTLIENAPFDKTVISVYTIEEIKPTKQKVIELCKQNPKMSKREIARKLGVSHTLVNKYLKA